MGTRNITDTLSQKAGFDVRFYGKSFSLLSIGHLTGILRGIASTYLFARWAAPETLGQFRYMITLYSLAGIFALAGYGSSMIKGLAQGESAPVHHAIRQTIRYAPLGSFVLLLAALDRFQHGEHAVAWSIIVAAISFVPYTLSSFYTSILTGMERIRELTIANVWSNTLYAILFILCLSITKDLVILTVAYFLFDILIRGWISWRAFKQLPPPKETSAAEQKLGNHMNWIMAIVSISGALSQILLQRMWGYAALAVFSVAMILPEQAINIAKTMSGTILQRLSRHAPTEKTLNSVRRQFWNSLAVSALLVLMYAAIAPFAIPLIFPQYENAILPSIAYSLCLLTIPTLIGNFFFQAHGNIRAMWRYYLSFSIIQLVTSIIFVPVLGGWGAIWSRVATRVGTLPFGYPELPQNKKETGTIVPPESAA